MDWRKDLYIQPTLTINHKMKLTQSKPDKTECCLSGDIYTSSLQQLHHCYDTCNNVIIVIEIFSIPDVVTV